MVTTSEWPRAFACPCGNGNREFSREQRGYECASCDDVLAFIPGCLLQPYGASRNLAMPLSRDACWLLAEQNAEVILLLDRLGE